MYILKDIYILSGNSKYTIPTKTLDRQFSVDDSSGITYIRYAQ